MTKKMTNTYLLLALLLLNSCASPSLQSVQKGGVGYNSGFRYSGVYFGQNFTKDKKDGVIDGCETAKGFYTKNHFRFRQPSDSKSAYLQSYRYGWFMGRNKCQGLHVKENTSSSN